MATSPDLITGSLITHYRVSADRAIQRRRACAVPGAEDGQNGIKGCKALPVYPIPCLSAHASDIGTEADDVNGCVAATEHCVQPVADLPRCSRPHWDDHAFACRHGPYAERRPVGHHSPAIVQHVCVSAIEAVAHNTVPDYAGMLSEKMERTSVDETARMRGGVFEIEQATSAIDFQAELHRLAQHIGP
jgi:hypothetical protein